MEKKTSELNLHHATEFETVCSAVRSGSSVLVIGETGSGTGEFAENLYQQFLGEMNCAIATYKGSGKKFFQAIAFQLDIPTEDVETGKPLTMDQQKEEILSNMGEDTLLIFPEAKRLTIGIRYWLEDVIANDVKIVCFSPINPEKDIFLEMLEVELELPSDSYIRLVMASEAQRQGLNLSKSQLASLQPLAGRNPMLARKVIQNEKLGLNKKANPQHTQYVNIMPVIIAALLSFGVVRFVGLGTNNQGMYITGGICLVSGMALRQLGSVKGARKRLGQ